MASPATSTNGICYSSLGQEADRTASADGLASTLDGSF